MAESTIHTKQEINNPVLRFSTANGPVPTSENSYPRCDLKNTGPEGGLELNIAYRPNSNTTYYNTLMDSSGKPAFGAIMIGWAANRTIPANGDNVTITASVPSGCRFLCWIGASSRGSVTPGYIEFMDLPSTRIWSEKVNSARTFDAYFLYCRGLNANT